MVPTDKNEMRKQMFAEIEEKLFKDSKPEDSSFYYHSSDARSIPHFIPRLQRLPSLLQCPLRYAAQYPYE